MSNQLRSKLPLLYRFFSATATVFCSEMRSVLSSGCYAVLGSWMISGSFGWKIWLIVALGSWWGCLLSLVF